MSDTSYLKFDLPVLKTLKTPPRKRTLEEYLRFEARSESKHEFIEGKFVKMANSRGPHNIIAPNFSTAIKIALKQILTKFIVFDCGQKVYFPSLDEGVYPDTLAVCEKPLYWDDNAVLLINPILVVEVLSKSTKKYDRTDKFLKYKTLDSFREYVLVEQDFCKIETFYREEPGLWRETAYTNLTDSVFLKSLGITISVAEVYENIEY
jgi:Uma2 family endonuclease